MGILISGVKFSTVLRPLHPRPVQLEAEVVAARSQVPEGLHGCVVLRLGVDDPRGNQLLLFNVAVRHSNGDDAAQVSDCTGL